MPKRRASSVPRRRKRRRKFYSRKKFRGFPLTRNRCLFSRSKVVKMRYCETISMAAGTIDVMNNYLFTLSSPYDPNYTGTGHQPLGFDQWGELYNHYMVLGAKATCIATLDGSQPTSMYVAAYKLPTTSTSYTTVSTVSEAPGCQYRRITGSKSSARMVIKYSKKKTFRNSKNTDLTSTFGSNPAENMYLILRSCNLLPGAAQNGVTWQVQIDFIVLLTEPKELATS